MTIKPILENWRGFLNESSLSRMHQHIMEHDCAILTAYRNDISDLSACTANTDKPEEGESNKSRNRDLKATLLAMGIGVTKVDGSYIEDFDTPKAVEVSEASLFCVNLKDDKNFAATIQRLGEKYCQDSVLIIPKGGQGAYLFGTNNAEFPGYGSKVSVGDVKFGEESEFMTKVRNRPFTFNESATLETYQDLSRNQRMAVKAIAREFLEEQKLVEAE